MVDISLTLAVTLIRVIVSTIRAVSEVHAVCVAFASTSSAPQMNKQVSEDSMLTWRICSVQQATVLLTKIAKTKLAILIRLCWTVHDLDCCV